MPSSLSFGGERKKKKITCPLERKGKARSRLPAGNKKKEDVFQEGKKGKKTRL